MYQQEQEMNSFRKALIIIVSVIFTGALLIYTAMANLNLLQQIYPDPQYVMFGLFALEGGVIYWFGYYLLHIDGSHKAIALVACFLDFVISMVGFFMDLNLHSGNAVRTALPPSLMVMTADIILNVGVGLLVHFLNHSGTRPKVRYAPQYQVAQVATLSDRPQPKEAEPMVLEQLAPAPRPLPVREKKGPGRRSTEEKYARLWLTWDKNGRTDETCPWENPREFRERYPDPDAVVRVLATANS